jgi:hypothetical protein
MEELINFVQNLKVEKEGATEYKHKLGGGYMEDVWSTRWLKEWRSSGSLSWKRR